MTDQRALDFKRLVGEGPVFSKSHVDEMIAALRGQGWHTAKDLGPKKKR